MQTRTKTIIELTRDQHQARGGSLFLWLLTTAGATTPGPRAYGPVADLEPLREIRPRGPICGSGGPGEGYDAHGGRTGDSAARSVVRETGGRLGLPPADGPGRGPEARQCTKACLTEWVGPFMSHPLIGFNPPPRGGSWPHGQDGLSGPWANFKGAKMARLGREKMIGRQFPPGGGGRHSEPSC